ncbi:MAG TPA: type II 3-dehydroquinate dehydratase [Candidatus Avibacteroides faecavium]|nr:type II 3-dehydroquinate dehydratase [Candidatus Avibacteroides faecavium]
MRKILILNGPNLNLTGTRQPDIYGSATMGQCVEELQKSFDGRLTIEERQSNHEGDIIDALQNAKSDGFDGVVLNAGGYSHTSVAIRDAITAAGVPVVEVHISNIYAREEFRRHSVISPVCMGVVAGFGLKSYELALMSFI